MFYLFRYGWWYKFVWIFSAFLILIFFTLYFHFIFLYFIKLWFSLKLFIFPLRCFSKIWVVCKYIYTFFQKHCLLHSDTPFEVLIRKLKNCFSTLLLSILTSPWKYNFYILKVSIYILHHTSSHHPHYNLIRWPRPSSCPHCVHLIFH